MVCTNASTCSNGDPYYENVGSVDENGCLIGYCDKVCPSGIYTKSTGKVTHGGNKGPGRTGSNGNAGPVDQATGLAVDPAAETYKKQIAAYILWAEKQNQNAERQQERAQAQIERQNEQVARQEVKRVRVPPKVNRFQPTVEPVQSAPAPQAAPVVGQHIRQRVRIQRKPQEPEVVESLDQAPVFEDPVRRRRVRIQRRPVKAPVVE